jgi:translation elongation factor EF-G
MKDKSLEEIKRGEQAEKILSNEVYREAFNKVKNNIVDAMQNSPLSDDVTHNRLVIALQTLTQIEKALKDIMQTGKMAKLQVQDPR